MAMNTVIHGESTLSTITTSDGSTKAALERIKSTNNSLNTTLSTFLTGERYPTTTSAVSGISDSGGSALFTFASTDYDDGDQVVASGFAVATAANGTWTITKVDDTTGTLANSAGTTLTWAEVADDTGSFVFTHLSRGYFVIGTTTDSGGDATLSITDGAAHVSSVGEAPYGTVVTGYDEGVPTSATAAFTGKSATTVLIKFKQFANAGAAQQYAVCHVVFNSSDAATDLGAGSTVRRTLAVGDEIAVNFTSATPCTSMHYLSSDNDADLALYWEYK